MPKDLGLQTPEQIESFNQFRAARANSMLNGTFSGGCVSTDLCRGCNHLFSDPTCMCGGLGVCPICGFDNSPKIEYSTLNDKNNKFDFNNFGFYSKNDFIKIVDKVFLQSNGDGGWRDDLLESRIEEKLREEIEKL